MSALAQALVARGGVLVDVRTAEEFAAGHLDGALNLPVQDPGSSFAEFPASDR